MADFKDFLDTLKNELSEVAREAGEDFKDELIKDGKAFVKKSKEDLERWMSLAAEGRLSKEELEYLIKGKKDLAEMEALKQKGLAKVKIDRMRTALYNSVINSVFKALP
jgi:hypothetical protein